MNFSRYQDKGLTGLANLGNTCFLNSTLQCLSHTYEFNDFLDKETYKKKINKEACSLILMEWDGLRKMMWSENCTISPKGFVKAVQKVARIKDRELFTGFAQNDLTEFLDFMIDSFHNSIKREVKMNITGDIENDTDKLATQCFHMMKNMYKKEYSEILNLFYGIHVSQIKSKTSDYINITPEPFFNLLLPIGDDKTLRGCFDLYTKPEDIMDIETEEGNKEECVKQLKFWSLPDVLIITLKRFVVDSVSIRKNQELIDFEIENLDLTDYVVGYDKENYIYDLYGVCNHSGSCEGGHYTSFVKNANNRWYHYNDTSISKVPNLNALKTPRAYCLFYRKKK